MLTEIDINQHNFSKIGKYISNKLHHIHKHRSSRNNTTHSQPKHKHKSKEIQQPEPVQHKKHHPHRSHKQDLREPTVGSYHLNYNVVDKNVHQFNFNRSTPHFCRQNYKAHENTPLFKDYPDGLSKKQKGFAQLKRMVGRDQIKGSIRKNLEDPHEARFESHNFPTLSNRSTGVSFEKMYPRKEVKTGRRNSPQYLYDLSVKLKRLDTHIIKFQRQTNRPKSVFNQKNKQSPTFRYGSDEIIKIVDKSTAWSKQLSREVEGVLPAYMEKSVTSRMAMSQINLKTLQMNCSDLKNGKKLARKKLNLKQKSALSQQCSNYLQI